MIEIELPTLHPGQVEAYKKQGRFKAIRCGRRWGKTDFAKTVACDAVIKGKSVGWFTPDYKIQSEAYNEIAAILYPVKLNANKVEGVIRTVTGGRIDFWTLENERAGRSRKYHLAIIDEAAFTKPNMMEVWEKSIKPTLLDYGGKALALSNTKGIYPDNFFYNICTEPRYEFVEYHAPTHQNPHIPERRFGESDEDYVIRRDAEFEALKKNNHPLIYRQEYLAEFVDWSGVAFFDLADFLDEGQPLDIPCACDYVLATIDTATKTGKTRDGTGVSFWAYNRFLPRPLLLLDWDLIQIDGDLLVEWLPSVLARLERYAGECGARFGSYGAYIEDRASGMILVQQAQRRGWPVEPIGGKLTSVGKVERAISVSSYVKQKMIGISRTAFERQSEYHEHMRNHWLSQVIGFRVGAESDATAEDDLLDTFTYGAALTLGNQDDFN